MNASELSLLRGMRRSACRLPCTSAARGRFIRGRLRPTSQCRTVQRITYRVARVAQINTNGGMLAGRPIQEGLQVPAARAASGTGATAVFVNMYVMQPGRAEVCCSTVTVARRRPVLTPCAQTLFCAVRKALCPG